MAFIQTLNKYCIALINIKDIQFIINNHSTMLLFHIYFHINKLVQKHNENVFINTSNLKFIFKAMDINH